MQKASGRLETIPQSASLTAPFTQGSLGWVRITQCTLSPVASLTCGWERKRGGVDMKLSPSGESAMERVHSDALLVQKEMGWNRPRCDAHRSVYLRDDVGARAASGGDKVLWECIDPYEAEVRDARHLIRPPFGRPPSPQGEGFLAPASLHNIEGSQEQGLVA